MARWNIVLSLRVDEYPYSPTALWSPRICAHSSGHLGSSLTVVSSDCNNSASSRVWFMTSIREIYFGELLRGRQGAPHVARYVEHFYLFGDHAGGRFGRADGGGDGGVGGGGGEGWDEGSVPVRYCCVCGGDILLHDASDTEQRCVLIARPQRNVWFLSRREFVAVYARRSVCLIPFSSCVVTCPILPIVFLWLLVSCPNGGFINVDVLSMRLGRMSGSFSEVAFLRMKRGSQTLLILLLSFVTFYPGRGRIYSCEVHGGRMLPVVHALGLSVEGVYLPCAIRVRESERRFLDKSDVGAPSADHQRVDGRCGCIWQ